MLSKVELQLEDAPDKVSLQEDAAGSVSDDQLQKDAFELSKVEADNGGEWRSAPVAASEQKTAASKACGITTKDVACKVERLRTHQG